MGHFKQYYLLSVYNLHVHFALNRVILRQYGKDCSKLQNISLSSLSHTQWLVPEFD